MYVSVKDNETKDYWNSFYKQRKHLPSSFFCEEVLKKYQAPSLILDVGCGSGRDSFAFAKNGHQVFGLDGSYEAVSTNKRMATKLGLTEETSFTHIDLGENDEVNNFFYFVNEKALEEKKQIIIYLRFLLHAINEETESILLNNIAKVFPSGTKFLAEFRTLEDKEREKIYDNHYRRYINTDKMLNKLLSIDYSLSYFYKGTGLSIYKGEDPFLARIFAEKK